MEKKKKKNLILRSHLMCSMVAVPKTLFLHAHRFCSYFDQETSIHRLGKNFAFLYIQHSTCYARVSNCKQNMVF